MTTAARPSIGQATHEAICVEVHNIMIITLIILNRVAVGTTTRIAGVAVAIHITAGTTSMTTRMCTSWGVGKTAKGIAIQIRIVDAPRTKVEVQENAGGCTRATLTSATTTRTMRSTCLLTSRQHEHRHREAAGLTTKIVTVAAVGRTRTSTRTCRLLGIGMTVPSAATQIGSVVAPRTRPGLGNAGGCTRASLTNAGTTGATQSTRSPHVLRLRQR